MYSTNLFWDKEAKTFLYNSKREPINPFDSILWFQAERKKERKALRGREQTNRLAEPSLFMVALNHNVHFWNEIKNAGIVVVLLVAYLFLMVPYVIRVKVDQIVQVSEVDQA